MKTIIKRFNQFANESLSRDEEDRLRELGLAPQKWKGSVLPSEDGSPAPGQLVIVDPSSDELFTGPTFQWLRAKKGIVETWNGSRGEETRLVVKCDELSGDSAIDAAVKEFSSQTGDYAELYKKVKAFLKKSV